MSKILIEAFEYYCNECEKTVSLDQNVSCPSCGTNHLGNIVANVLSNDSKCFLIYDKDKDSIDITDLTLPSSTGINKGAVVVQVTKDFFEMLKPDVHYKTPEDGICGKCILSKMSKTLQTIIQELRSHAIILNHALEKPAKPLQKKKVDSQLTFDDPIDTKKLTDSLQLDWKARTKSFLDNELFVDFE